MRRLLPLVMLSLIACEPPPPPVPGALERTGDVVSVVNGQNVTQGMIDARLSQLPERQRDQIVASGKLSQLKDAVVTEEVLYQEAVKRAVQDRPEVKNAIAMAARQAMIQEMVEAVATERATDAAAQTYYDEHKVQYAKPQVKARHVLVRVEAPKAEKGKPAPQPTPAALKAAEAEANAILAEVKGGADFSEVAKAKSKDPGSAAKGGDLGWFEKGRMVPEFADAAFAAEKGAIVGPIKTQFGYHIILVDDKRDATPFEEVKEQILETVKGEQARKFVDELKAAATITAPGGAGGATVTPEGGAAAPAAPTAPAAPAPAGK